jgi:hypothetical protein
MNSQICWRYFGISSLAVLILFITGCSRQTSTVKRLPSFFVTNEVVNGELRQVLEATNGLSLYFTESYITVWFCKGSDTVIGFDPKTLKPQKILWEIPPSDNSPGQAIFDVNADGVPDIRKLKDVSETRQIFFKGEWYTREMDGSHTVITIDGEKQRVYFDGQRWIEESTNSDIAITNALLTTRF